LQVISKSVKSNGGNLRFEDKRRLMVENQIIARGIRSPKLIEAFLKVERHEFVPKLIAHFAYADHPLSIGEGQTISQPYIVAYMIDLLGIEETDSVLEIGTGSGYQTAILAEMAKEVFTIERFDFLAQNARKILKKLKYNNINFSKGDGTLGWTKSYPAISKFDKIIVSAGAPSIPKILTEQLEDNGRMIIPVGSRSVQELKLISKNFGSLSEKNYGNCVFVPLIGTEGWEK